MPSRVAVSAPPDGSSKNRLFDHVDFDQLEPLFILLRQRHSRTVHVIKIRQTSLCPRRHDWRCP